MRRGRLWTLLVVAVLFFGPAVLTAADPPSPPPPPLPRNLPVVRAPVVARPMQPDSLTRTVPRNVADLLAIQKRVGLIIDGRQPVREGADVLDAEGSMVGRVTSGGFAPSVGKPIAMAYVPTAMAEPGTQITVSQRGKVHHATVTAMPFIPHRYVRAGA